MTVQHARRFVLFSVVASVAVLFTTTVVFFMLDEISDRVALAVVFAIAATYCTAVGVAMLRERRAKSRQRHAEAARQMEDGRRLRRIGNEPTIVIPAMRLPSWTTTYVPRSNPIEDGMTLKMWSKMCEDTGDIKR